MADGASSNFGFVLPEVGSSTGSWGEKLNANFQSIDDVVGKIVITPKHFGGIGDGVADDTDAWVAMLAYMQTNGVPAHVEGGTWLIRCGELVWTMTSGSADIPGPVILTSGKVMLKAKSGTADAAFLSIHNWAAGGGKFVRGGQIGDLWFDDTTSDTAPNRHGLELYGIEGIRFGYMQTDHIKGDLIHLKEMGTSLTADQWHIANCQFYGARSWSPDSGWVFNNNSKSQVFSSSYIGFLYRYGKVGGGTGGAFKGGGARNVIRHVSSALCLGWAVDTTPNEGTTVGFTLMGAEIDGCEYGIKINGHLHFSVSHVRIVYRIDEAVGTPAGLVWPLVGFQLGGTEGRTTRHGLVRLEHNSRLGLMPSNQAAFGKFLSFANDSLVNDNSVYQEFNPGVGGLTFTYQNYISDINASSFGNRVRHDNVVLHDSRKRNGLRARMTAAVAVANTGYGVTRIIYPSEVLDDATTHDTATGEWTSPFDGRVTVRAVLGFTGLTAGNRIRMGICITPYSTGTDGFKEERYHYAAGTGLQSYEILGENLDVKRGDRVWITADQNNGSSVNTAGGVSIEMMNRFEIVQVL